MGTRLMKMPARLEPMISLPLMNITCATNEGKMAVKAATSQPVVSGQVTAPRATSKAAKGSEVRKAEAAITVIIDCQCSTGL